MSEFLTRAGSNKWRKMLKLKTVFVVSCLGFAFLAMPSSAQAAPISQWATSATSDNQYDETYTATEATGAANATGCDNASQVWATATKSDIASITLTYENFVSPTEIDIYQNNYVNAITNVEVSLGGEVWKSVFTGDATQAVKGTCDAAKNYDDVLVVPAASAGKGTINMVRITVDQTTNGWAEIDAVKLIGNPRMFNQEFGSPSKKLYKDSPIGLAQKTWPALIKIKWTSMTPKVCKFQKNLLKAIAIGKCKIRATNAGNANYNPLDKKITLTVIPGKSKPVNQAGG